VPSNRQDRLAAIFIPFKVWNKRLPGGVFPVVRQKRMKQKHILAIVFGLVCATGFASMAHPFGRVKGAASPAPLLAGAPVDSQVTGIVSRSCQNCHSEKTEWPLYSYIAPMSWMIEKDVHDARSHMNLSRWRDYSPDQRQQILAEIGSLVRNHGMAPQRYLLLHPEARLSTSDVDLLYKWTRSERKRLKAESPPAASAGVNLNPAESGGTR
jgi:hypothetical protein